MIDYVIEGGVDYIVALGTTAETPTLYMPEARRDSHVHHQPHRGAAYRW